MFVLKRYIFVLKKVHVCTEKGQEQGSAFLTTSHYNLVEIISSLRGSLEYREGGFPL